MITAGCLMAVTIAGAIAAVTLRNVLHAIFGLAISLFGVAGIFLVLNSPFVAAMEILIYVGGISIAMIFAVMLSTVMTKQDEGFGRRLWAGLAAIGFFVGMSVVIHHSSFGASADAPEAAWSVQALGLALLQHYNLVFETLSVVLLLAIVGAVVISRQEPDEPATAGTQAPAASATSSDEEAHV